MNKACGESGRVFEAEECAYILAQMQERSQGAHVSEGRVGNQGEWGMTLESGQEPDLWTSLILRIAFYHTITFFCISLLVLVPLLGVTAKQILTYGSLDVWKLIIITFHLWVFSMLWCRCLLFKNVNKIQNSIIEHTGFNSVFLIWSEAHLQVIRDRTFTLRLCCLQHLASAFTMEGEKHEEWHGRLLGTKPGGVLHHLHQILARTQSMGTLSSKDGWKMISWSPGRGGIRLVIGQQSLKMCFLTSSSSLAWFLSGQGQFWTSHLWGHSWHWVCQGFLWKCMAFRRRLSWVTG